MKVKHRRIGCEIAALVLAMAGCAAPRAKLTVTDPDPGVKIPAIKHAAGAKDMSSTAQLVKDLESDDSAVRFFAIEALFRLTGQRLEYDYYASEEQRAPAVQRWQEWLRNQSGPDVVSER